MASNAGRESGAARKASGMGQEPRFLASALHHSAQGLNDEIISKVFLQFLLGESIGRLGILTATKLEKDVA